MSGTAHPGLHKPIFDEPAALRWLAGSLFFALLAAAPLLLNAGFLNTRGGGDSPFLLFRLHQLEAALREGVFPVRWMPDAAFGLGYPFFSYYAALPFYFAAGFRLLGFSYVLSLKLTHLLGFLVAAWGMFAWVRRITGRAGMAFIASAAYTFAPYHLVNLYVRGDSLAEFWAMAWFPLILLTLYGAAQRPTPRRMAFAGLAFGALVMTHNVSALIFAPFAAVYALGCGLGIAPSEGTDSRSTLRRIALLAGAGGLGLALAAWVWVPALGEQGYVQLEAQTSGYFFYANHFRGADLIQPALLFDYDTGSEAASPFSMGLAQAALIAPGLVGLAIRLARERTFWRDGFLLFGLVASTLMITPLSRALWDALPLLPLVQFPWRFLSIQALFGAAVTSAVSEFLPEQGRRGNAPLRAALICLPGALLAVAALGTLRPDFIPLTDADVTPERLRWYEAFSGNIGTTIRYEYLPTWTRPRPYSSDVLLGREPRAKFLEGTGTARRLEAGAADQVWAVEVESASGRVALPLLYWPGWRVEVDGQRAALTPLEGLGYVQFDVPQGRHTVRLWLGRTPLRLGAELVSLAGLAIFLALWRPRIPRPDWMGWSLAAGGITSVIVVAMVLHSLPKTGPTSGPLNADFAQEAYFYRAPIRFEDGVRLTDARYGLEDGVFSYRLLREGEPEASEPSLTLVPPPQQAGQGAAPIVPAGDVWRVEGVTPGLYFPQIASDAPALTANGLTRGPVVLAPVVIPAQHVQPGGTLTPDQADFGPFRLVSVSSQERGGALRVTLWWEALAEATRNYAIALRLYDAAGNEWAALDAQAGSAGMYPTGLWQMGEIIPDTYHLTLPEGTPPGGYMLRITLYDAVSLEPIGQASVEGITYRELAQRCPAPDALHRFAPEIGLDGASFPETLPEGEPLGVEAGWLVDAPPEQAYRLEWVLLSAEGEGWRIETPLVPGADPRSWLPERGCSAYVLGRYRLDVPRDLPPGDYALVLRLLSETGEPLGRPYQAGTVRVEGRMREFDVPSLETPLEVTFGDQLKLWGYTLRQDGERLDLEIAWGALADPATDYKSFVHLFDPSSGQIVAQLDSMPRGYTYPTSRWVRGEVVTEILTLDLSDVPPGTYRIALGWYDPATGDRLPALSSDGSPLPDARVVLEETITIR